MVEGFFSSLFWLFNLKCDAVEPKRVSDFIQNPRFKTSDPQNKNQEFKPIRIEEINLLGVNLLHCLFERWSRLCEQLWKCNLFLWGLKSLIRRQAARVASVGKEDPFAHEQQQLSDLLTAILTPPVHDRESVDALNACAPPGASEAEKGELDFSPLLRAFYWRALELSEKEEREGRPIEKDDACLTASYRKRRGNIIEWGLLIDPLACFAAAGAIERAERKAFAPADATNDAFCLFEDVIRADGEETRHFLLWSLRGLFMSLQNPKVARQVEKGKTKETEKILQKVYAMYSVANDNSLLSRFVGALILRFRSVLSTTQKQKNRASVTKHHAIDTTPNLSDFQTALVEWLRIDRQTDQPLKVLSQIPICALCSFLEEEEAKALACVRSEERDREKVGVSRSFLGNRLVEKGVRGSRDENSTENTNSEVSFSAELNKDPERDLLLKSRKERKATQLPLCDYCGGESAKAKHCRGCKLAVYCSRECQKSHWKRGSEFAERAKRRGLGPFPTSVPHKLSCPLLQQRVLPNLLSTAFVIDLPIPPSTLKKSTEAEGGDVSVQAKGRDASPSSRPSSSACPPHLPLSPSVSVHPQSIRIPLGEVAN